MITFFKSRSLALHMILCGLYVTHTGCSGSQSDESDVTTDKTQEEAAEAPAEAPAEETHAQETPAPAPSQEAAAVPAPAPQPATAAAAPQGTAGAPGQARVVRYIAVKEAVLRAAPSDSAAKVGVLSKGERVMIVEEQDWGRISDGMFVKLNALSAKAIPRSRAKAAWTKPGK